MWLDFDEKKINFSRKGFFKKEFSMELDLPDEKIEKLKPCIAFHGEPGAKIRIIGESFSEQK